MCSPPVSGESPKESSIVFLTHFRIIIDALYDPPKEFVTGLMMLHPIDLIWDIAILPLLVTPFSDEDNFPNFLCCFSGLTYFLTLA